MGYAVLMKIADGRAQLMHHTRRLLLGEALAMFLPLIDFVEELGSFAQGCDDVDAFLILKKFVD